MRRIPHGRERNFRHGSPADTNEPREPGKHHSNMTLTPWPDALKRMPVVTVTFLPTTHNLVLRKKERNCYRLEETEGK